MILNPEIQLRLYWHERHWHERHWHGRTVFGPETRENVKCYLHRRNSLTRFRCSLLPILRTSVSSPLVRRATPPSPAPSSPPALLAPLRARAGPVRIPIGVPAFGIFQVVTLLSFPLMWLKISAKAKKLERAGKNLSRTTTKWVAAACVVCSGTLVACGLLRKNVVSSAMTAVFYVVAGVVYMVASKRLQKTVGNGAAAAKVIATLARRISISLAVGVVSLLTYVVCDLVLTPENVGVIFAFLPTVFVVGVNGSFSMGHYFLLRFLGKSLRVQSRRLKVLNATRFKTTTHGQSPTEENRTIGAKMTTEENEGADYIRRLSVMENEGASTELRPAAVVSSGYSFTETSAKQVSSAVSVHPAPVEESVQGAGTVGGRRQQAW